MSSVTVIEAGYHSTIQDRGRWSYRDIGVPISGVMNQNMAGLANRLLHNQEDDAVLEMTLKGATLLFNASTYIAVTAMELWINEQQVSTNSIHRIEIGDLVKIGSTLNGNYGYLAIKNGFKTPVILGSRSMMKTVTTTFKIAKSDHLPYELFKDKIKQPKLNHEQKEHLSFVLKAYPGPEWHQLDRTTQEQLLTQSFELTSQCNRMAFTVSCGVKNPLASIASSPVLPGTIQWIPSDDFLILMRDAQTTGGYPRILQLTEESINILSQLNQKKVFSLVII